MDRELKIILTYVKEHLCAQPTMIPLVAHHVHSVWFSSIQRIFKRFLICKQIWTYCKHQKVSNVWCPYWRRHWTCKWKMSFSKRRETENNMQVCFNILVLHRKLWYCIPKEVNLYCSMLRKSQQYSFSDRNWRYHQRNYLTFFSKSQSWVFWNTLGKFS